MSTAEIITIWARKGAAISNHGKMCGECAFRRGAKGNLDEEAVDDAACAVAYENSVFHCHLGNQGVCSGYLYAKSYFEAKAKK